MSEHDVSVTGLLSDPNEFSVLLLPVIHKKDLLEQYLDTLKCDRTERVFIEDFEDFTSLWIAFMEAFDGTMIADGWFDFLFGTVKNAAVLWCEENHIRYDDDFQIL